MTRALLLLAFLPLLQAQPLYPWLEAIAQQQLAQRAATVAQLKTPGQIRQRAELVRANLTRWIGGLPAVKTPLNIQRTGTIHHPDYRVEKIIFESQPRFFVTANLYVPKTGPGPFPAVLQPTGHSLTAKARELYQSLSIGLVKYGFVVLTYDPLGQGERRIFFDPELNDSKVGGTTVEHQMVGVQSLLGGQSLARYMIWDGIRALDLLQAQPEVDPNKIGVSGCSGGGTLTAYIAALDSRVQAAAPSCYITSWVEQLKGTGPQDAEQQFPDQLLDGFDHGDLLIAMAPKPYLIASTTEDFFPLAGAQRTYQEAKEIYNRFGAEDKISWFTAPGPHGMRADTRAAVYAWMRRWLQNKPGPAPEPDLTVELEEDLNATSTGQLATSLGGETASTANRKAFAQIKTQTADLPAAIGRLTRYQPSSTPLNVQSKSTANGAESLTYEAEPGRPVPALLFTPPNPKGTVLVADASGKSAPAASAMAAAGYTVLSIDSALTGDTAARRDSYSAEWFPQDKAIWLTLMTGKTVTGLRMADIIRGLDLLASRNLLTPQAILFARGNPGVAALHAAVLDPRISQVIIEDLSPTYRTLASTPIHRQIFDTVIPNVLRHYDLPQLAAHIAPRKVILGRTTAAPPEGFNSVNIQTLRRRELTPITAYLTGTVQSVPANSPPR
jgi:dienelactone hydrolase